MQHYHFSPTRLLAAALLLAGAVSACQKAPQVEDNPTFDPEKDAINAAFVLSVATGSPSTKMSAANVQQGNSNFLGIDNAKLFLYDSDVTTPMLPFVKPGVTFKEQYDLGPVLTPGAISTANNAASSSNRVLQLTLPLGADAALFYGKATNSSPGKVQGKMQFDHIDSNPANTWFGPSIRIGSEENVAKYDATARLMIKAINTIIQTSVTATDGPETVNSYTSTAALPAISWPQIGHQWEINNNGTAGANPYGRSGEVVTQGELEKSLGAAYATFTHIKNGEFRAGSSSSIKSQIMGLYDVLEKTSGSTPLNDKEANAARLAQKAIDNVNLFFATNWDYKSISDIKSGIVPVLVSEDQWNDSSSGFAGATPLNSYPYITYGIPEGAAQLQFDPDSDTFSYMHPNKALVTPGRTFDPKKYVYPAELAYYVNSPLYTNDNSLTVSDYPNGTTAWSASGDESKWGIDGWTIGPIASTTRCVAIKDNINYGVALMETSVLWTEEAATSGLEDNRHAMTGEDNRVFPVSTSLFELRGVLIGGVHPRYNWQFIPRVLTEGETGASMGVFDGVIYDDAIPSSAIPTATPNYTLVYDNYDYTKEDDATQNDVYVALEFVNRGDAFWGKDNLIPTHGVFYLGAKLVCAPKNLTGDTSTSQSITWPTDHQVPPINETTGVSKKIPRVFIQDFLTKATFRIGHESLKYAYYTVPDLKTSQMSFGLSVDLSWENGYEYDIEFGNNPGPDTP